MSRLFFIFAHARRAVSLAKRYAFSFARAWLAGFFGAKVLLWADGKKPNSLCLSARVNGERTETVELSLIDFRVLQSRGLFNGNTPYHDRIIRLVESNANLFRRQLGA